MADNHILNDTINHHLSSEHGETTSLYKGQIRNIYPIHGVNIQLKKEPSNIPMKLATLIIQQKNKLQLRMKHQEKSTFLGKISIIIIKKILEYSELYQRQTHNYSLLAVEKSTISTAIIDLFYILSTTYERDSK